MFQSQSVDKLPLWPWPLNFWPIELLTPKCIGIFLLRSCIYVWNMKTGCWKRYLVRIKVLTKFRCDLDLWTPKCIGIFLLPSCIFVWNMKAVSCWKLLKLSCQNQCVDGQTDGRTDGQTWFQSGARLLGPLA